MFRILNSNMEDKATSGIVPSEDLLLIIVFVGNLTKSVRFFVYKRRMNNFATGRN